MSKIKKNDKAEIIISLAVALESYKEVTSEDEYNEKVEEKIKENLISACVMFTAEYITKDKSIEKSSARMAKNADNIISNAVRKLNN